MTIPVVFLTDNPILITGLPVPSRLMFQLALAASHQLPLFAAVCPPLLLIHTGSSLQSATAGGAGQHLAHHVLLVQQ